MQKKCDDLKNENVKRVVKCKRKCADIKDLFLLFLNLSTYNFARFACFGRFVLAVSFRSFRTFQWFRFVVLGFSTCPRSTLNKYTGRLSTRVHRQPTNILAERPLMSVNIATKISLVAYQSSTRNISVNCCSYISRHSSKS